MVISNEVAKLSTLVHRPYPNISNTGTTKDENIFGF